MNIHEYQAKDILKSFGVQVQTGIVADNPDKALSAAKELNKDTGTSWYVIKAQIHAGGRGKGKVKETGSNGVVLAKSLEEVPEKVKARAILMTPSPFFSFQIPVSQALKTTISALSLRL